MHHVLIRAINPALSLARSLTNWPIIARRLAEPTRTRQRQMEILAGHGDH